MHCFWLFLKRGARRCVRFVLVNTVWARSQDRFHPESGQHSFEALLFVLSCHGAGRKGQAPLMQSSMSSEMTAFHPSLPQVTWNPGLTLRYASRDSEPKPQAGSVDAWLTTCLPNPERRLDTVGSSCFRVILTSG
jgi:hypothetical protein